MFHIEVQMLIQSDFRDKIKELNKTTNIFIKIQQSITFPK